MMSIHPPDKHTPTKHEPAKDIHQYQHDYGTSKNGHHDKRSRPNIKILEKERHEG